MTTNNTERPSGPQGRQRQTHSESAQQTQTFRPREAEEKQIPRPHWEPKTGLPRGPGQDTRVQQYSIDNIYRNYPGRLTHSTLISTGLRPLYKGYSLRKDKYNKESHLSSTAPPTSLSSPPPTLSQTRQTLDFFSKKAIS